MTELRFLIIVTDKKILLPNGSNSFVDATQISVIAENVEKAVDYAKALIPKKTWYHVASIVEERL